MRVAMIDPSLFTWPYDSELALALDRAGHDVAIYGSESRLGGQQDSAAVGLLHNHFYQDFHRKAWLSASHQLRLAAKGLNHVVSMKRLVKELHRTQPDAIHFQWTPLPIVDRCFLPALRSIAPLVLTIHDSMPFNGTPRSTLQNWGARSIASRFDQIIVHTHAAVERVVAEGVEPRRIHIVPHGPLNAIQPTFDHLPPPENAQIRLLFFGKIKPYKGLDVLLQALAALPEDLRHRWHLRVVGEPHMDVGPLVEMAALGNIADHVDFDFRFVEEQEIPALFATTDLLIMPYRQIDASGVLMSSLAAGLPVVASRLGLFAELLVDGEHGRLVESGDADDLRNALSGLIRYPHSLAHMGSQVRRLVADIPDWDEIARRTSLIYAHAGEALPHSTTAQSADRHPG